MENVSGVRCGKKRGNNHQKGMLPVPFVPFPLPLPLRKIRGLLTCALQ
jgi:hypothetical protein